MGKHSEWRKQVKKERRKRKRQSFAELRRKQEEQECLEFENSDEFQRQLIDEKFQRDEEERQRLEAHERWLKIEEEAQKQWRELQVKLNKLREERARQNEQIRAEWEREQKRLTQLKEAKEKEREAQEKEQLLLKERVEDFIENGGNTPEHLKTTHETNPGRTLCPFFDKTNACRFQDGCSRNHVKPGVSRTLLIPGFFSHYSLELVENEHGDSSLEYENHETYQQFREFFFDILPELEKYGTVRQLKVCCNHEPHLRGNVYVEYSKTREAVRSFRIFNGRWYGGKQLSVEFCNVKSWRSAICGLFFKKRCPKGNACNFLHVFNNPRNLFQQADGDLHRTPPPKVEHYASSRRNWRWSESPERISLGDLHSKKSERKSKRSHSSRSRSRHRSKRKS